MRTLLPALLFAVFAGCGSDGLPEPVGASADEGAGTIGLEDSR